ncbi:MAG TPA: fatty acid desaturase CarF family protein [Candidatus Elarobacter sp.]|jgi:ubiquitin-conjugating enzyme E2 variant
MHLLSSVVFDVLSVFACLLAVDVLSGLLHWLEDTWTAPGKSALLDRWIVQDNIEHHRRPGAIRAGDYWGTNRVCIVLSLAVGVVLALCGVHAWQAYLIVALASQSNQVHLWAHSANPPRLVRRLQTIGLLQSTAHHAEHHKRPYASRFCTFTNFLNPALDRIGLWRGLERLVRAFGVPMHRATAARGGY